MTCAREWMILGVGGGQLLQEANDFFTTKAQRTQPTVGALGENDHKELHYFLLG